MALGQSRDKLYSRKHGALMTLRLGPKKKVGEGLRPHPNVFEHFFLRSFIFGPVKNSEAILMDFVMLPFLR